MKLGRMGVWVLAAVAAWPLCSIAQDADTLADIRCIATGMHLAEAPDSHQKSTGTLLVLYYLGRVDGRAPRLDIQKALARPWFKEPLDGWPEKDVEKIIAFSHALVPECCVSIPRFLCLCVLVLD